MIDSQRKKALVFISAGLGDAILMVPLVRLLKENGYDVSAIITSPFPCEQLFEGAGLFERMIIARSKTRKALLALKEYRNFQLAIVNYFAASRSNLLLAKQMATMVHTNRIPEHAGKRLESGLIYFVPQVHLHDAEQNMLLAGKGEHKLQQEQIEFLIPSPPSLELPKTYVALQISANHNKQSYKNWPVGDWISFLHQSHRAFPHLTFVLLGDVAEASLAEKVMEAKTGNVISLAGQTTIFQATEVIQRSALFLGLDGGLMHIAAAAGKPSLSLWGPSNPLLYGYEKMNPEKHRVVSLYLGCAPCSAWLQPNTSRFNGPEACTGHECLSQLSPDHVFGEFSTFVKKHELV
jgi:heptosyltransferase-3